MTWAADSALPAQLTQTDVPDDGGASVAGGVVFPDLLRLSSADVAVSFPFLNMSLGPVLMDFMPG